MFVGLGLIFWIRGGVEGVDFWLNVYGWLVDGDGGGLLVLLL